MVGLVLHREEVRVLPLGGHPADAEALPAHLIAATPTRRAHARPLVDYSLALPACILGFNREEAQEADVAQRNVSLLHNALLKGWARTLKSIVEGEVLFCFGPRRHQAVVQVHTEASNTT